MTPIGFGSGPQSFVLSPSATEKMCTHEVKLTRNLCDMFQKTGHAVRAIGRLSSMAMISGLSGRKASASSPTSPTNTEKVDLDGKELH